MNAKNSDSYPDDAWAGARLYSASYLKVYDLLVHGIAGPLIWRCPPEPMLAMYDRFVSANHLDVGVGTGYMLDKCRFPSAPRLFLLDINQAPLAACQRRLERYHPQILLRNVLEPIEFSGEPFDSIGMNWLIHCVPGSLPQKAVMFDHLGKLLKPGGVIFGSTLVGEISEYKWWARPALKRLNKDKVFSNLGDHMQDLRSALSARFEEVSTHMVGSVALFSATKTNR